MDGGDSQLQKEISLAFQTDKHYHEYGRLAKQVESYGFDRISVYNDLFYQPAWYPLMAIAQATTSITIGPAAINPYTTHPINIAGNIDILHQVAPNRVYLGLARGAWLDSLGIIPHHPLTDMADAFKSINHFLAQNRSPLYTSTYSISEQQSLRWNTSGTIPLMLGSWGPKTIKKCIKFIDEVKLGGTANPSLITYMKNYVGNLTNQDDSKTIGIVAGAVCVVDNNAELAKQKAREEVALYLPVVARLDSTIVISPKLIDAIEELSEKGDFVEAAEYIPDDILQRFSFAGNPEDIINQCIQLYQAGADRIELGTPHGIQVDKGLSLLGEKVVPAIREYISQK